MIAFWRELLDQSLIALVVLIVLWNVRAWRAALAPTIDRMPRTSVPCAHT